MRHPRTWTQDKITTLTYTYLEEPSPGQQNRLTLSPLILASIHGSCLEQWLLRYSHGDFLFQLLPPYMHYLKLLCKGDLPLLCHLLICISVDNRQVRTYCRHLLCCSDCSNSDHLGVLSRWCLCSSDIFLLFVCFTSSLWSRLILHFPCPSAFAVSSSGSFYLEIHIWIVDGQVAIGVSLFLDLLSGQSQEIFFRILIHVRGFPGGSDGKELFCNAGDVDSTPGGGNDNPLQYSCLENPLDGGAWPATVHRFTKESDTTQQLTTTTTTNSKVHSL